MIPAETVARWAALPAPHGAEALTRAGELLRDGPANDEGEALSLALDELKLDGAA